MPHGKIIPLQFGKWQKEPPSIDRILAQIICLVDGEWGRLAGIACERPSPDHDFLGALRAPH
jgi:hypothetical protein